MDNDRNRPDEQYSGPSGGRQEDRPEDDQVRSGVGEEIRSTTDEGDEEFEDMEDVEESDEDSDASF
jgi:hypothetical protein